MAMSIGRYINDAITFDKAVLAKSTSQNPCKDHVDFIIAPSLDGREQYPRSKSGDRLQ